MTIQMSNGVVVDSSELENHKAIPMLIASEQVKVELNEECPTLPYGALLKGKICEIVLRSTVGLNSSHFFQELYPDKFSEIYKYLRIRKVEEVARIVGGRYEL